MPAEIRPDTSPPPPWRDRVLAAHYRRGWRGFLSLQKLLKPRGASPELQVVTRYGSQFFLVATDEIDRRVLAEGFYESEVLDAVRPVLGPPAVLWVVGANFGLHAITAKRMHPATRVVAFEPSPAMGARLLENCRINALEVELHAYALGDAAGCARFYAQNSGNPGMSTLHPEGGVRYNQRFHVGVQVAADVIERGNAPAPTALIIDAEGSELEVLRGFRAHLAAPTLRTVVFEAANDLLTVAPPPELAGLIRAAGFTVARLPRAEATGHALSNFVAIRP
jgi:FkbM family methyltransferase